MSDRIEWHDTTSGVKLLFPGEDIDGVIVENGQVAIAFGTESNGIALSGPPQDLASRLEQVAAIARTAAEFLAEPLRHLPDGLDPRARIAAGVGTDTPEKDASTRCGTPGITVADPAVSPVATASPPGTPSGRSSPSRLRCRSPPTQTTTPSPTALPTRSSPGSTKHPKTRTRTCPVGSPRPTATRMPRHGPAPRPTHDRLTPRRSHAPGFPPTRQESGDHVVPGTTAL